MRVRVYVTITISNKPGHGLVVLSKLIEILIDRSEFSKLISLAAHTRRPGGGGGMLRRTWWWWGREESEIIEAGTIRCA